MNRVAVDRESWHGQPMQPENAQQHLEQAVSHLREVATCLHRRHPELAAIFWQYGESLGDCDLDGPILTLVLPDEFLLEVE